MFFSITAGALLLPSLTTAYLTGSVGPTTSTSDKAAIKTCNILDYGAVADNSTDVGQPIMDAAADCSSGGIVYIPEGDYNMKVWAEISGGSSWGIQLDGIIYRGVENGGDSGHMFYIAHADDFEFFSSTSKGAIQGLGYQFHLDDRLDGPRLVRLVETTNWSFHDIALVDSPLFHAVIDNCENGEIYNTIVRGGDSGGLDGFDVSGENIWIHDVEVTNKDECVTIKSPAHNMLVTNVYCNWSGGCAMGSLGTDTDISDITYRNIYTQNANQMYMIKSYGGGGNVSNVWLENFIGHTNAYSLDIDQYWSSMDPLDGDGVQLNNITIRTWRGTEADGLERGPVKVVCADGAPCTDVTISDFAMWTESGDEQTYNCRSAYGSGTCLEDTDEGVAAYDEVTVTVTSPPSNYTAATMPNAITSWAFTEPIAIPAIPTTFFPGATPASALAGSS
jgi:rhamnogalacturonan hydrolase